MNLCRYANTTQKFWLSVCAVITLIAALVLTGPTARAQSSAASLDGIVLDTSGALVPGAAVILRNQASGDERTAVSNAEGFFNFAAIPPATYTVRVSRQGFATWEARDITLTSGDHRAVSGIKLKVGTKDETVVVEATTAQITPTDSGEKSFTIDQNIMQNVAIVGQNAAEFIKIMPGFAMTGGSVNQSSYAASDERTGGGPNGSFSANGQRQVALDITSDGAHIIDPGGEGGTTMNTATDMTSEVTVQTSNFGADSAKGPVVINAVGKSGGQQFHGEAYTYNRYYSANANDWLNNYQGVNANTGVQLAPRPETKYWYPGAQIGGPVMLPLTHFNHNHDKLFFFFAFELYRQNVDNGIYTADVPTDNMRKGDFTQSDSNYYYAKNLSGGSVQGVPNKGGNGGDAFICKTMEVVAGQNSGNPMCTASMVNPASVDASGQGMMSVFPHANADPAKNNGYNYIAAKTRMSNMNQYRARVDYSISNSTKLFVQYNHQNDNAESSLGDLWVGSQSSWDSPTTPYPSPLVEKSDSETVTTNMTKVFTPTLTNELLFNWVYVNLPNSFKDRSKVERGTLGINYTMLFDHGDSSKLIYPEMDGWGDGIPNQLNGGFELNGTVFAKKTLPSLADNVTKVWKTHTAKFGFYWERTWNSQPGGNAVNGTTQFDSWQTNGSGNAYGNMLIGQSDGYTEQNFNVIPAFRYISAQFYATDSWKVSRKLTMDYGVRFSHLGPWTDTTGYGFAAWYPALYAAGSGPTVNGTVLPGIEWNKVHSSTSLAGAASRVFFYSPRVGFAWDIFGSGKSILRGGYGIFNFHDEQNVQNSATSIPQGSFTSPSIGAASSATCPASAVGSSSCQWTGKLGDLQTLSAYGKGLSAPSSVSALDPTDSHAPQTEDWSLTWAERAPWKSLVEVAYVGNKSDYLSNYNNNLGQINYNLRGTLFTDYGWLADCNVAGDPNSTLPNGADNPDYDSKACAKGGSDTGYSSSAIQAARPYQPYGTLNIISHKMYSNYHSFQATWNKQQGHVTYLLNYTFSKALGIRGENGSAVGDPTSLKKEYGTLPNNRPQIFNAAYVIQTPNLSPSANWLLRGAANNWQISGITQYQTGADMAAVVSSNFSYTAYIPAGTTFMGKTLAYTSQGQTVPYAIQASTSNVLGSSDLTVQPVLTCNPGKNLKSHQYINGACFSPFATPGEQGPNIFPKLIGPGFFNSDLSVFKSFPFGSSESRKLTFRFSGYNFLNHPVRSFNGNSDNGLKLNFDQNGNLLTNGGQTFGYATEKTGHRIMQGEAKFSF
jgi:hypothetical protein